MKGFSKYFQFRFFIVDAGRQFGAQSLLLFFLLLLTASCKKYLDEKPDKKLVVPTTVQELQGLLDYHFYMNDICSDAEEVASDNYFLPDNIFLALTDERNRSAYLWKSGIFIGAAQSDWQNLYTVVYNANVVLDNIESFKRDPGNADAWDNCKGSALIFRAKSFYEIAQIWAKGYDSLTAFADLGIPLRLTSDFNKPSSRSSIQATYNHIISDLQSAIPLLPNTPIHPYRPSKAAAYALLARTYLTMGAYENGKKYADSCLQIKSDLIDFNSLSQSTPYVFGTFIYNNPEDIMHTISIGANNRNLRTNRARIDSTLYRSYDINDLRKTIFFGSNGDGTFFFQGHFNGSSSALYNGITTSEIYLVRAECYARLGNVAAAMSDLNALMIKRWKNNGTFIPFSSSNAQDATNKVLSERRKELIMRMSRFSDIKRLNIKGANITIVRRIQGQTYTLPPNDPRFALPIPEDVIQYTGMQQN